MIDENKAKKNQKTEVDVLCMWHCKMKYKLEKKPRPTTIPLWPPLSQPPAKCMVTHDQWRRENLTPGTNQEDHPRKTKQGYQGGLANLITPT